MEKRLYVFENVFTIIEYKALNSLSDEEFKNTADYSWSLEDFQRAWNDPERDYVMLNSDTTVIRFI